MQKIAITKLFPMLERYNGMATPTLVDAILIDESQAPIAPDPLNSDDPKIRAAAEDIVSARKKRGRRAA
ncbi:MAG: hypothetical protein JOZ72_09010 [Alphaproteobacteria bacterium]|nr:hypothetical protein [Alphaproteobacteria bacterium]